MQKVDPKQKINQLKEKEIQLKTKLEKRMEDLGGCGGMNRMPADRFILESEIDLLQVRLKNIKEEILQISKNE